MWRLIKNGKQHQSLRDRVLCRPVFFFYVQLSAISSEVYRYLQEEEGNNPVINIDLFSLEADVHCCADMRVGTHMRTPVPSHRQWECDYMVYFVCRHPLDRCICYANLDGFSVWIPNQNHILKPLPSLLCVGCLLAGDWRDGDGERVASDSYRHHMLTIVWWMGGTSFYLFIWLFSKCVKYITCSPQKTTMSLFFCFAFSSIHSFFFPSTFRPPLWCMRGRGSGAGGGIEPTSPVTNGMCYSDWGNLSAHGGEKGEEDRLLVILSTQSKEGHG